MREQLLVAKENLLYCECSLAEAEGRLVSVSHDHDKIIKTLKTELLEVALLIVFCFCIIMLYSELCYILQATMNKDELLAENGRLILRLVNFFSKELYWYNNMVLLVYQRLVLTKIF